MDEEQFRSLMAMAKSLQSVDSDCSEYWIGFQRGLRRLYHGEKFGTDDEHQKFYNCRQGDYRRTLQAGYRAGFHFNDPDMLFDGPHEEYDFSKGIRGKYANKYKKGTNVVVIDPDVAEFFPNNEAVNDALRSLIPIIKKREKQIAEK